MRCLKKPAPKHMTFFGLTAALLAASGCGDKSAATSSATVPSASVQSFARSALTATASAARTHSVKRTWQVRTLDEKQASATARADVRAAYIQAVQAGAGASYRPRQSGSELLLLENPRHHLHAELAAGGVHFLVDDSASRPSASFKFLRYGCDGDDSTKDSSDAVRPVAKEQRAVYTRGAVSEWYHNGPLGVEQGFDLASRPSSSCAKPGVALTLEVKGDLSPVRVERGGSEWLELRNDKGEVKLRYSDLSASDEDGKALPAKLMLSGNRVTLSVDDTGARYPLHVDPLIWAQLGNEIKLSTPTAGDAFGTSIAVSGDTAVVGAPMDDTVDTDVGCAWVFTRTMPGQWMQRAQLNVGVTAGGHLGQSVAISDTAMAGKKRIVLGAPDDNSTGSASFFLGSGATWTYEDTQAPMSLTGGDLFGTSVGVSDDRIIVGGPGYNTNDGYAAIYEPVAGVWTEIGTFLGATGSGEKYGFSVAIDTTLAMAGAPLRDMGATDSGGYDAFLRVAGVWGKTDAVGSSTANARLGAALSLSGTTVVDGATGAGGTGAAFADAFNGATGKFINSMPLAVPNGTLANGDLYGNAVAVSGTFAVVAAVAKNGSAGDVFLFENVAGTWTFRPPAIFHKVPSAGEQFGSGVALNPTGMPGTRFVLVGAPGNDTTAANSGAFYEIVERKGNGDTCSADVQCGSDFCVDGVCCNSGCGRTGGFGSELRSDCQSCIASDTGGTDGICAALNSRQQCRASTGMCDLDAFCQPGNMACPPNPMRTAGTLCRAPGTGNLCDAPEFCDGKNPACPADGKMMAGTPCRPSLGPCDAAETCDGTSVNCPADAKQTAGTPCRMATDLCDRAETCDGSSVTCPADAIQPYGVSCRMAADECDIPEVCDGANKRCPNDDTKPDDLVCMVGTCQSGACRPEADLAMTIIVSTPAQAAGAQVQFTATAQNNGPAAAAQVQVQLVSNEGGTIDSVTGNGWTCQASGNVQTCSRPDLASGASAQLLLVVTPPTGKREFSVSAIATAMTFDPLTGNNTATAVTLSPLNAVLAGGGFGCTTTSRGTPTSGTALLGLALLTLALRRRRRA